jgi:AcrR family transcriptional regulator
MQIFCVNVRHQAGKYIKGAGMVTASLRPGGRSARIQASVHRAVIALQKELGRDALTVPLVAATAGVTASTIYRRWGDLQQLLSDVALDTMRADTLPQDTGSFVGDVTAWLDQFVDEMSSGPGREMMRDVLGSVDHANAGCCSAITAESINVMRERGLTRGEMVLDTALLLDRIVAPIIYRILFTMEAPSQAYAQGLLHTLVKEASATR